MKVNVGNCHFFLAKKNTAIVISTIKSKGLMNSNVFVIQSINALPIVWIKSNKPEKVFVIQLVVDSTNGATGNLCCNKFSKMICPLY